MIGRKRIIELMSALLVCLCTTSLVAIPQPKSSTTQPNQFTFGKKSRAGIVESALIDESSGLACSGNYADHFWTHNDGGSTKGLFLVSQKGKLRATLKLPNSIPFRDWEDMARVKIDGTNYLIVGDVGDNLARNRISRLIVFQEPAIALPKDDSVIELSANDVATIEFQYDGGPRNCEAMAVDIDAGRVYFVSKRDVFRQPDSAQPGTLTTLHWIPLQTTSTKEPLLASALPFALNRRQMTGMSISPDGNLCVLRSYLSVYLFHRQPDQTWADRFAKLPDASQLVPLQRQGEAIGFSADGRSVFLTSEGVGQPFWKIELDSKRKSKNGR